MTVDDTFDAAALGLARGDDVAASVANFTDDAQTDALPDRMRTVSAASVNGS